MKYDLKDVTFTMAVRVESTDRSNNIKTTVQYLLNYLDTNIMIYEDGKTAKLPSILGPEIMSKIIYKHIQNNEYIFHRTKVLNELAKACTTDIIVNYDADIILKPESYMDAVEKIRAKECDFITGFVGDLKKVPQTEHSKILKNFNIDDANTLPKDMVSACGGCVYFNKQKFIEGGMENERFKSWGYEDNERMDRFIKMGLKYGRTKNQAWHLEHTRPSNNWSSNPHLQDNKRLYETYVKIPKEKMAEHVKNFEWLND